jgi:hypothetical protein
VGSAIGAVATAGFGGRGGGADSPLVGVGGPIAPELAGGGTVAPHPSSTVTASPVAMDELMGGG